MSENALGRMAATATINPALRGPPSTLTERPALKGVVHPQLKLWSQAKMLRFCQAGSMNGDGCIISRRVMVVSWLAGSKRWRKASLMD